MTYYSCTHNHHGQATQAHSSSMYRVSQCAKRCARLWDAAGARDTQCFALREYSVVGVSGSEGEQIAVSCDRCYDRASPGEELTWTVFEESLRGGVFKQRRGG